MADDDDIADFKSIPYSAKLRNFAIMHYGEKVLPEYLCQKRCFYSGNDVETKYDCILSLHTFLFQTKNHASIDLAKEQAASIAVRFLKSYKSAAIEKHFLGQGEKLKNIFQIPSPEQRVPRVSPASSPCPPAKRMASEAAMGSRSRDLVPSSSTEQITQENTIGQDSADPLISGNIISMEGNPVDILQKIATDSVPSRKVLFQVFESGPGFKVDCKVESLSFQAFSQNRKTAKKLAALVRLL